MRPLPSRTAERASIERRVQPESTSPRRILVVIFEVSLKKIPIRLSSPMIVPTSVNGGAAGATGSAVAGGGGTATTLGGGGRRDEENSGRSRVTQSLDIGISRNGLPALAGPAVGSGPTATGDAPSALRAGISSFMAGATSLDCGRAGPWAARVESPVRAATPNNCSFLIGLLATVQSP